MRYRVAAPSTVENRKLPVVYLLHGNGGDYRDWSNYSDVTKFARSGVLLVMPEGDNSYYVNAAEAPADKYGDYIVQDLVRDVEKKFPAAGDRANRAIAGVSMGGFGAIQIGLSHPDLYVFAGGLSAAIDVPRRAFSIKRIQQYRAQELSFGAWDSASRHRNDPFVIASSAGPSSAPYFYLSCGDQEGLLAPNREFAALLTSRGLRHEFHEVSGGHDWNQWNGQLADLFERVWSGR